MRLKKSNGSRRTSSLNVAWMERSVIRETMPYTGSDPGLRCAPSRLHQLKSSPFEKEG